MLYFDSALDNAGLENMDSQPIPQIKTQKVKLPKIPPIVMKNAASTVKNFRVKSLLF
jgi:hypothetical protein